MYSNIWDVFKKYTKKETKVHNNQCKNCEVEFIISSGIYVCPQCGLVGEPVMVTEYIPMDKNSRTTQVYKRNTYFKDKLKLLAKIKQCRSKTYDSIVKKLSKYKFNTVQRLREIMQKLKMGKYYKYIYGIYYDIKKVKLFNLNEIDINRLNAEFKKIEQRFKDTCQRKSNMMSYNVLIYVLLKKLNYDCYRHVLLPKNYKKVERKIVKIVS